MTTSTVLCGHFGIERLTHTIDRMKSGPMSRSRHESKVDISSQFAPAQLPTLKGTPHRGSSAVTHTPGGTSQPVRDQWPHRLRAPSVTRRATGLLNSLIW